MIRRVESWTSAMTLTRIKMTCSTKRTCQTRLWQVCVEVVSAASQPSLHSIRPRARRYQAMNFRRQSMTNVAGPWRVFADATGQLQVIDRHLPARHTIPNRGNVPGLEPIGWIIELSGLLSRQILNEESQANFNKILNDIILRIEKILVRQYNSK